MGAQELLCLGARIDKIWMVSEVREMKQPDVTQGSGYVVPFTKVGFVTTGVVLVCWRRGIDGEFIMLRFS